MDISIAIYDHFLKCVRDYGNFIGTISHTDLTHSALFERLIYKRPIYLFAPPRSLSYPWYDLLDERRAHSVLVDNIPRADIPRPHLMVNQTAWMLEHTIVPEKEYIISWPKYLLRVYLKQSLGSSTFEAMVIEMNNPVVPCIDDAEYSFSRI